MTDKQWVVVPREPTQEMIEACRSGLLGELGKALVDKQSTAAYRAMLAASPRYEPGDAVEVAAKALWQVCDTMYHGVGDTFENMPDYGQDRFRDQARAALTAAFPELLARIEALESALLDCARQAEALKRPCGESPESAQAIRNGQYQNVSTTAHIALGTISGPKAEVDRLRKGVV